MQFNLNKKTHIFSTLLVLVGLGITLWAAPLLFQKKGESSIQQSVDENNLLATTIHRQDYSVLDTYTTGGTLQTQLLDIQKDITTYEGAEGIKGHLDLALYRTQQTKFDTLAWKISEEATEWTYNYEPQFMITHLEGCCGAMSGSRVFNFKTGQQVLSFTPYTYELGSENLPLILEIPNTPLYRIIGVLSADSTRDFPPQFLVRDANGFQTVALVSYANDTKLQDQFIVKIKVPENFSATLSAANWIKGTAANAEIRGSKASLWDVSGRAEPNLVGGVNLELTVNGENSELKIKIPVAFDGFDYKNAEVPKDVQIVPINPIR